MPSKEELLKMTVADLKGALKVAGLPVSGKKEELAERLAGHQQVSAAPAAPTANPADASTQEPAAPNGVAQAAPAQDAPAQQATAQATDQQQNQQQPKRAKIEFSEEAVKAMPSKITVVKPAAAPSEPVKTDAERMRERADRFKDPDVEKAKKRAERFGTHCPELEKERARKRAERFGTFNPDLEEERKQKRAARFNIEAPEAKLAARAARFKPLSKASSDVPTSEDFEAKKKERAARFATKA